MKLSPVSLGGGRLLALLAFCIIGFSVSTQRASAQTPFYQASAADIAGPPGTLISSEPMFGPVGAQAYRILYRSTGLHDEPIAVSGVVVIPPDRRRRRGVRSWRGRIRPPAWCRIVHRRWRSSFSSR
jgi:hypothetical protein